MHKLYMINIYSIGFYFDPLNEELQIYRCWNIMIVV